MNSLSIKEIGAGKYKLNKLISRWHIDDNGSGWEALMYLEDGRIVRTFGRDGFQVRMATNIRDTEGNPLVFDSLEVYVAPNGFIDFRLICIK